MSYYPLKVDVSDYSGNGNNLITNDQILTNDQSGITALEFPEINPTTVHSQSNMPFGGSSDRTLSFWCKLTTDASYSVVSFGWGTGKDGVGHVFEIGQESTSDGRIEYNGAWNNALFYPTNPLPYNQWRQITFTCSQGNLSFYLNGTYQSNVAISPNTSITPINICGWNGDLVRNIRVYNRALSSNEVSALYTLESTPPTPSISFTTNGSNLTVSSLSLIHI